MGYGPGGYQKNAVKAVIFALKWRDEMVAKYPTMQASDDANFITAIREIVGQVHAEALKVAMRDEAFSEQVSA